MKESHAHKTVEHGITDNKGRSIGGRITVYHYNEEEIAARATLNPDYARKLTAKPFVLYIQATRDGKAYGAGGPASYYPTLDAALLAGTRKLEQQAKRYRKQFSKA